MLTRRLHEIALAAMKRILDLGELTLSAGGGRESGAFRYYRAQVMSHISQMESQMFQCAADARLAERCECGADLEDGPRITSCRECAGCGWRGSKQEL